MDKVYQLLEWLRLEQAVEWLASMTGTEITGENLMELCKSGHCSVYIDSNSSKVTDPEQCVDLELIGRGKVVGSFYYSYGEYGASIAIDDGASFECDAFGVWDSSEVEPDFHFNKSFKTRGRRLPWFNNSDIKSLAEKMNSLDGQPTRQEIEDQRKSFIDVSSELEFAKKQFDALAKQKMELYQQWADLQAENHRLRQELDTKEVDGTPSAGEVVRQNDFDNHSSREAATKRSHMLAIAGLLALLLDEKRPRYDQSRVAKEIEAKGWRGASASSLTKLFAAANTAAVEAEKEAQAKVEAREAAKL